MAHDTELSEILQVRVSPEAMRAIKKCAASEALTVAAFVRRTVYRAAKIIRPSGAGAAG
jgi:uncharacterized protein (DUF1778 family)